MMKTDGTKGLLGELEARGFKVDVSEEDEYRWVQEIQLAPGAKHRSVVIWSHPEGSTQHGLTVFTTILSGFVDRNDEAASRVVTTVTVDEKASAIDVVKKLMETIDRVLDQQAADTRKLWNANL